MQCEEHEVVAYALKSDIVCGGKVMDWSVGLKRWVANALKVININKLNKANMKYSRDVSCIGNDYRMWSKQQTIEPHGAWW